MMHQRVGARQPDPQKSQRGQCAGHCEVLSILCTKRKETEEFLIRVRPLNGQEKSRSTVSAVAVDADEQTLRFDGAHDPHLKPLTFDTVFMTETEQHEVFANSGIMDLLDRSIDGYASTIFAFGQTGSGKTFTMTGPPDVSMEEDWGVVPRSLRYLWDAMEEKVELVRKEMPKVADENSESIAPGLKFNVRASYLEVYNETVPFFLVRCRMICLTTDPLKGERFAQSKRCRAGRPV